MNPLPDCYRTCRELKKTFWLQTEPKIPLLQDIISSHFGYDCGELTLLDEGAYARAYETSLSTGKKLVVRVVLAVREGLKTEAEVATMDFVRGTSFLSWVSPSWRCLRPASENRYSYPASPSVLQHSEQSRRS